MSTKINATVDALGNPTGFTLTPGQACDLDGADILLPQIAADIVIADKGFDADERVIAPLEKAGKRTVIPPKANRKHKRAYDKDLYQARHLIDIDQAWRLSRLCCGGWGDRRGTSRRQASPRHRRCAHGLQGHNGSLVRVDEFGVTGAGFYKAAA